MIIIGTGASASIDPERYATMFSFFSAVVAQAKSEKDKTQIVYLFTQLDRDRVFQIPDSACENLAVEYQTLIGLKDTDAHKVYTDKIRDEYLNLLKARFDRTTENLEIVLSRCQETGKENSFTKIGCMINWLLSPIAINIQEKANRVFGRLFDKFIGCDKCAHIVSFNYDLLCDNSLLLWCRNHKIAVNDANLNQIITRQDAFIGKIDSEQILEYPLEVTDFADPAGIEPISVHAAEGLSRLYLIKPHGSLSFCKVFRDVHKQEVCLLIRNNYYGSVPLVLRPRIIDYDGSKRFLEITPLIVAPAHNKIKSHPVLFEAERNFLEGLATANKIVVVGWSIPDTDVDHYNAIRNRILNRNSQIEELVVFDLKQDKKDHDQLFDRFEALFQPKVLKRSWEGFSERSIDKHL